MVEFDQTLTIGFTINSCELTASEYARSISNRLQRSHWLVQFRIKVPNNSASGFTVRKQVWLIYNLPIEGHLDLRESSPNENGVPINGDSLNTAINCTGCEEGCIL
jgi:hypothetical protein